MDYFSVIDWTRLESDLRASVTRTNRKVRTTKYAYGDGRMLAAREFHTLVETADERPYVGGLYLTHSPGSFLSVDRVQLLNGRPRKGRRIVNHLNSRPGQISSILLLELLKMEDGAEFSKHVFIRECEADYFGPRTVNVSTRDLNETLSRMFRRTMDVYFEEEGRQIRKNGFTLGYKEFPVNYDYHQLKPIINRSVKHFVSTI